MIYIKKSTLRQLLLFLIIAVALGAGAWWSLKQDSAIILREQPILQLTPQQIAKLSSINKPLTLEIYARRNPQLRRSFTTLLRPLQLHVPTLTPVFIHPDTDPVRVQSRDITREGQLYLTDGEKGQRIDIAAPQTLATALLSSATGGESQILHLQGHGERAFFSDTAGNWRDFYQRLKNAQTHISDLEINGQNVPKNTDLLVIADPKNIDQKDSSALQSYLALGGNLLYTTDTNHPYLPPWLAKLTGLKLADGVMIDAKASDYGLNDPQMLVVENLGDHAINQGLKQAPLLPTAVAIIDDPDNPPTSDWTRQPLLWSSEKSWSERGSLREKTLKPDANELAGALPLGWILERQFQGKKQTLVILGDSDLFHATYLPIGGNSEWAQRLFAALQPENATSSIAPPVLGDQFITIPEAEKMPLAIILLFLLPISPPITGLVLAWRRKQKYS